MNLYPWRLFVPRSRRGAAWQLVEWLKKDKAFSRARLDIYMPSTSASQVIVCLGQMHTVLSKRGIWWWTARSIARVQARLFAYYYCFATSYGISAFGEEGMTHDLRSGSDTHYVQFRPEAYALHVSAANKEKLTRGSHATAIDLLSSLGKDWLEQLKFSRPREAVAASARLVSGARLAGYALPHVRFYPIEGERAYGHVRTQIDALEVELKKAEQTNAFQSAKAKGFKKLTREEYDAAMHYNTLTKKFTRALRSDVRERACFEIALGKLQKADLAVFTMGVAHRFHFRRLAPQYAGKHGVGFVFITPPELWWWGHVGRCIFVLLMLSALAVGLWYVF